MDTREKSFYDALGVVPDVPADIIEKVERSVRQSGVKRRALLAACLLLAIIIPTTLIVFTANNRAVAYADDHAMDELFYAFEFLAGGDDDGYPLLDEVSTEDSAAAYGARQQAAGPDGEQLTKKSPEKGMPDEK
jgi:hypothetical protein